MKKTGLFAVLILFFIFGCTGKGADPVISAEFLRQTGWTGTCTRGEVANHISVLFINDTKGLVYYDFHLDKPSAEDNITYSLADGRVLAISELPDELSYLAGEWILSEAIGDYIRFLNGADNTRVLELTGTINPDSE